MTTATRRQFLHRSLLAGTGLALSAASAAAIEPIRRSGPPHLRLSLAAYSYRDSFVDYQRKAKSSRVKPTMTLDDFIDLAAGMDLDAVELTAYYFPETTADYLAHLKGRCTRLGLDVSGTAVGNNFCVADAEKLQKEIDSVKQWTEHSARLGAKTMRIFAGNVAKNDNEEKARSRCVAAIQEACDHAAKYGIYLALENHGGITSTTEQLLALVKAVKHDWFGVNLDTGNFHTDDPYSDLEKIAPYAVTVQIKTEIERGDRKKEEADLKRLLDIVRAVRYRGYVALEYEAAEDARTAVPRHIDALRKLVRSSPD
jgi:sugar phosphate isomerase/epimerase